MRVLFVGNGYGKFAGLRHTNGDTRLVNGLIRNGHYVFFFSDRDEARNASILGLKAIGKKRTNEKLLKVVKIFSRKPSSSRTWISYILKRCRKPAASARMYASRK